MGTKEKLFALLEAHKGEYLSGESLAESLEVSRTAVWKAISALRKAGYAIDAVQNRGYCLDPHLDVLTAQGIEALLPQGSGLSLEVLPVAGSTNALVREKALLGAPEGCVVIANCQTSGRGRLGRTFFSPPDTGIYLSLLLRPQGLSPAHGVKLTTMAAVAAAQALEAVSGRETGIKWVNDIFMDGKKVCGILTEASFDLESGCLEYVILGVGINAYLPEDGFPPEIAHTAGAVFADPQDNGKNRLAAAFLSRFLEAYHAGMDGAYSEIYRAKSLVIGKEIDVITPNSRQSAVALDVDRDCHLIVRYTDGTIQALSSAEVSIRPK